MRYAQNAWTRLRCRLGSHPHLHVVHRFGAAALVACPHCNREFAMHDGLSAWLRWDGEIEEMYVRVGANVAASRAEWRRDKRPYPPSQLGSYAIDRAKP